MNLYDAAAPQFAKMLHNLDRWLEAGIAHATAKKFDPDVLLSLRLAPDMYPLTEQVQSACDAAKFACVYLTGKTAPAHPDNEKTMDEVRARIRSVIGVLETFKREDFEGAAERRVSPQWMRGKWLPGGEYLFQAGLPNFYFHVTTAYDILRHNGVELGKQTFIGALAVRD